MIAPVTGCGNKQEDARSHFVTVGSSGSSQGHLRLAPTYAALTFHSGRADHRERFELWVLSL
jgi:hypothetical protein